MKLVFNCYIFLRTICIPTKTLKLLKLASTTEEMTYNTLFSFCWTNLCHSSLKNSIFYVEFSFNLLVFQSYSSFYFFHVIFLKYLFKKSRIIAILNISTMVGFSFHDINVQSTIVDWISNTFRPDYRVICKMRAPFIFKLKLLQT